MNLSLNPDPQLNILDLLQSTIDSVDPSLVAGIMSLALTFDMWIQHRNCRPVPVRLAGIASIGTGGPASL